MKLAALLVRVFASCIWATATAHAQQPYFQYNKSFTEHRKDAVFVNHYDVTINFGPREDGGQRVSVYRGPIEIFGATGETRTFQSAKLECILKPQELDEIKHALDALELQRLPDRDRPLSEDPQAAEYPAGIISYGDVLRAFVLTPDATQVRKVDELVESFIKKIGNQPRRYWEPKQWTFAGDDQPARQVTFEELAADPIKFHGTRVRVTGYYTVGFEESALWPNAESNWKQMKVMPFWVNGTSTFADKKLSDTKAMAGNQMVTVEGTFNAGSHGHIGIFRGEIDRTTRFTLADDKEQKTK